jgi:very-short-patch-repair endonuclease
MDVDEQLRRWSEQQHGLVARRQAYGAGMSREAIRHRLRTGSWQAMTARVLQLAGAPATDLSEPMAAVLHHGPEAYVGHSSALALWGLPGFTSSPVTLLARRSTSRHEQTRGVILHSTRDLFDTQIASLQGVAIVTPVRAIFDIAGRAHPKRVERALDTAWARRLISYAVTHRTLDELAKKGRPGIRLMRELAAARPAGYRPPESNTEGRLNQILEQAGERPLRRQVDVGTQTNWAGRVDLVDDCLPLCVEVQSELFHGSVLDQRLDRERIERLRAGGHEVLEIWESDVWRNPPKVVADVRSARRRARLGVLGVESVA